MPLSRPARLLFSCFCIIQTLASCAGLPVSGNLPHGIKLEQLTRIPPDSPFAPDPAGKQVALTHDGLVLMNVATRNSTLVTADAPQALAWTPDGRRLAAAFPNERGSQVRIFDTGGNLLNSNVITGKVSTLVWRGENELLVATMEVTSFSFGANFVQVLYRWELGKPPIRTELQNSTLRPKAIREQGPGLYRLFTLALSPYGDAIVYTRLQDPPLIAPNLRYILRNLATGSEREVAIASLSAGGALFAGVDDRIVCGDGATETVLRDSWHERNLTVFPYPGRSIAASGSGATLLIDGNLLRSGQKLVSFPADAAGSFNADGSLLFVRQADRLLLVSGLPADPPPSVPDRNRDRFMTLRQWRSEGLITPADFTTSLDKMEKP